VPWVVQHYITLAGAGTTWDPDPFETQTGEFARDGQGNDLPLTTIRSGQAFADAHVVDANGEHVDPGTFGIDIAFAVRTKITMLTAGGNPVEHFHWNRGPVAPGQRPGIIVVEKPLPSPVVGTVLVFGGNAVPATNRLAVRVWRE